MKFSYFGRLPCELVEHTIRQIDNKADLRKLSEAYQDKANFETVTRLVEDLTIIEQRTKKHVWHHVWPVLDIRSYTIPSEYRVEIAERVIRNARLLKVKLRLDFSRNFI